MSSNAELVKMLNGYIQYIDKSRYTSGQWSGSDDHFLGFIGEVSEVIEGIFSKNEKDEFLRVSKLGGDSNHVKGSANARGYLQKLAIRLQINGTSDSSQQPQKASANVNQPRASASTVNPSVATLHSASLQSATLRTASPLKATSQKADVSQNTTSEKKAPSRKVFVVHGHDDLAKKEVEVLLLKLGLEPVILHDQPNNGKTIIEKFEVNADQCAYAVVLLTPDDIATSRKDMKSYHFRARQNVIYELGFFSGKLGRNKVCALSKNDPTGNIELPSDFLGVVYVSMDENGSWRIQLAKEMKSAGLSINLESLL
ncbi:hypothetical protein ANAEL_05375 [Anaerolineales bacterium]|nr:hypothetical protein ANAEL_05375 [Anaerolineales bacterium]